MSDEKTLRGVITKLFYSSPKFSAGRLRPVGQKTEVSFAGKLFVRERDMVTLRGVWGEHPKFGEQFQVSGISWEESLDVDGLAAWLAMHGEAIGIGEVRAKRIAVEYGSDFGTILRENPEAIAGFASVPLENIKNLAASWSQNEEFNLIATKLAAFELTKYEIEMLLNEIGGSVVSILQNDPYLLLNELPGFGFQKVDKIAQKMGIAKDHPGRIRAGIIQALRQALDNGSTCSDKKKLILDVEELLCLENAITKICKSIDDAVRDREQRSIECVYVIADRTRNIYKIGISNDVSRRKREIENIVGRSMDLVCSIAARDAKSLEIELHEKYKSKRAIYSGYPTKEWFSLSQDDVDFLVGMSVNNFTKRLNRRSFLFQLRSDAEDLVYISLLSPYIHERLIARTISSSNGHNPHWPAQSVDAIAGLHCSELHDDSQERAVRLALSNRISVITGAAGSGKTTIIKAIVAAYRKSRKTVALCAPTGKAARRLEEVVKHPASTIHRLLGYNPKTGFQHDHRNTIMADAVICDEVSMVDSELAFHLFDAIGPRTAIVLVGDHHQLPPVGAGALLRDCITHELTPLAILGKCHRQAGPLKENCNRLLEGYTEPSVPRGDAAYSPWIVHDQLDSESDVLACIEKLYREILGNRYGFKLPWDVQFLSPIHKGPIGTKSINALLQRIHQESLGVKVPPSSPDQPQLSLHVGDKVIQTRNNYELEIMNGHQGRVIQVKPSLLIEFDGRAVVIPNGCRGDIELAYCLTPHKCVHPDTIVETSEGLLPIRLIANQGTLAGVDGQPRTYRHKVVNPQSKAIRITTKHGYQITVTNDHRAEVWDGCSYVMRTADELLAGQWVRLRMGMTVDPDRPATLPGPPAIDVRAIDYRLPATMTNDVAEFFGLMVADGTVFDGGFRLLKRHRDVADRFADLCRLLFGCDPKTACTDGAFGYEVHSTKIVDWLHNVGGMEPNAKNIPEPVLRSPIQIQASFLRGLFEDATANIKGETCDHIEFSTIYEKIARVVQVMLLRLEIPCSVREIKDEANTNGKHYRLYIYGRYVAVYRDAVGFISQFKHQRLATCRSTDTRYPMPISRHATGSLKSSVSVFAMQNARYRGTISRDTAKAAGMHERLEWFDDQIVLIEAVDCESMCVEVPDGNRFLQNGFPWWNCQGSEWPVAVTVVHRVHGFMLHRNWIYTACTRARQSSIIIGDSWAVRKASERVIANQRRTLLPLLCRTGASA